MSGCSDSQPCPVCGSEMSTYSDYKPVDYISGECPECGFYFQTEYRLASKKGLKQIRAGFQGDNEAKYKPKKNNHAKEIKEFEERYCLKLKRDR